MRRYTRGRSDRKELG